MNPIIITTIIVVGSITFACFLSREKKEKKVPETKLKCDECKHYIDATDAQVIAEYYLGTWTFGCEQVGREIYCPMHKKPYDYKQNGAFFKTIPEKSIEVDSAGKEIKKK